MPFTFISLSVPPILYFWINDYALLVGRAFLGQPYVVAQFLVCRTVSCRGQHQLQSLFACFSGIPASVPASFPVSRPLHQAAQFPGGATGVFAFLEDRDSPG